MIASIRKQRRRLGPRMALAALAAVFMGTAAEAQLLPGAAPRLEIAERLRANGYSLIGPLKRRDTVYLADVQGGDGGRQRLVIDAWSGEILQRFVARPGGGYVVRGGEFDGPPPLGPPPKQDFLAQPGYAYGQPQEEPAAPPRSRHSHSRTKQRPATEVSKRTEPERSQPTAASPPNAAPEPATPAEAAKEPDKPETPTAAPQAAPAPSPAAPTAEARKSAPPAASPTAAASAPAAKADEKSKPNDVPVNPLE
ncbi:MAG TPA: hypothetical protein VMI72_03280 [Roseiarcus sp.]|nr:hypothetical protein [Roseiarcus sp.]